jgi:ribonuclease J
MENELPLSATLKIIPLGGLGEIGLNMALFEYGEDIIIVDCGLMFPEPYMLGIDLVIPDISYLRERADMVRGIFLTHGHEDHIGALPYVLPDLNPPIYGTALTLGFVREKLKEYNLDEKVELRVVKPRDKVSLGCFEVEIIRVSHSIVDGSALAIRTPEGVVIHTGDFKLDQTPVDNELTDLATFSRYGEAGVLALMSDSTNVEREGYTLSEKLVGDAFFDIFPRCSGRIIVAAFSSNIHRVQQVVNAAVRSGRKVLLNGRSMLANVQIAREMGYLNIPDGVLIELKELPKLPKEEVCMITTGSQGEPMSALTRIAMDDHKQIKLERGDTVIL